MYTKKNKQKADSFEVMTVTVLPYKNFRCGKVSVPSVFQDAITDFFIIYLRDICKSRLHCFPITDLFIDLGQEVAELFL